MRHSIVLLQTRTDCSRECVGAAQCLNTSITGCCNYFDFADGCVSKCPPGQTPNADHDCSGAAIHATDTSTLYII